ncbi:hypothetical protein AAG570_011655 [Ranatra chinensis]|uniref:Uncharacterized protein n=1 Tax=Ranatra chinensis TaxID=642074 RepID=A0ABD0YLF3_9HEMI
MSKDNATPGETRTSLIQALINYEDQDIANTVVGTTAGQETTTEVSTTIREDGTTELGATTDMTTTEGVTTKDTTTTELTTQEITTTEATTTTTTTTTTKPPRQPLRRVRVSRVRPIYHSRVEGPNYRRGKGYRNVDTETAVHGAAERRTHPQEIERINSAKLYIPPADAKLPYNSDARAVELLKSLYNLAAKWG